MLHYLLEPNIEMLKFYFYFCFFPKTNDLIKFLGEIWWSKTLQNIYFSNF
jgi:hypothetical protein